MRTLVLALAAIALVLGVIGLVQGGFSYVENRSTADVGPLHVTVDDANHVDIPPALAVLLLATGAALLVARRRMQ